MCGRWSHWTSDPCFRLIPVSGQSHDLVAAMYPGTQTWMHTEALASWWEFVGLHYTFAVCPPPIDMKHNSALWFNSIFLICNIVIKSQSRLKKERKFLHFLWWMCLRSQLWKWIRLLFLLSKLALKIPRAEAAEELLLKKKHQCVCSCFFLIYALALWFPQWSVLSILHPLASGNMRAGCVSCCFRTVKESWCLLFGCCYPRWISKASQSSLLCLAVYVPAAQNCQFIDFAILLFVM